MAQTKTQFGYRRHPDQDRAGANAGRTSRSSWSAPGRWGCRWRSIWRSAANPWCCSTMPTGSARARARSAFQNARWNSGTGSASASAWSTRAWCGASARSFTATRSSTSSTCCRRRGTSGPPSSTCSNSMPRPIWSIASRNLPAIDLRWRNKVIALEQRNDHVLLTIETPDGPYRLQRRLRRRLRRRPLVAAADGGRGIRRAGVRGPVPDRRRQDDGGVSDRALVLVRSAVPCRPLRAAAQAAGRHLADRPAAQSGLPIRRSKSSRKMCGRGSRACSATTSSISNGSRSTNSSAGGWTSSSMAA